MGGQTPSRRALGELRITQPHNNLALAHRAAIALVAQALRIEWALTRLRGSVLAFRTHAESRVGTTRWEVTVKNLITRMRALMRDDSGQDLLEYALLVALIALVAVAAVTSSGQAVNSIFSQVATRLQQAAQASGA